MNTSIQNCMVAQSGGPTVAINASLAGVIKGAAGCYGTSHTGNVPWFLPF